MRKSAIVIGALVFTASRLALGNEAVACFNICKLVREESQDLKCNVEDLGISGTVLYLDVLKKPLSTRSKINLNTLLSCYFKTGGSHGEVHHSDDPKRFRSCGPAPQMDRGYFCESLDIKHSTRKLKKAGK